MAKKGFSDVVTDIIRYEEGEMLVTEVPEFFANLYNIGHLWNLQGRYQRTFSDLLASGRITINGKNKAEVGEFEED